MPFKRVQPNYIEFMIFFEYEHLFSMTRIFTVFLMSGILSSRLLNGEQLTIFHNNVSVDPIRREFLAAQ